MQIHFSQFHLDEKDFFVIVFGLFLIVTYFFHIPVLPFQFSSLIVVFLFLVLTRTLVEREKYFSYLMIALFGLVFSMFLSPYSLIIYFVVALIIYKKTNFI